MLWFTRSLDSQLFDQICSPEALTAAWKIVRRSGAAGIAFAYPTRRQTT